MGHEFHKIWIKQCEAAEGIGGRFNRQEALAYLVGEKFSNFVRAARVHAEFEDEIPNFVAEVRRLFDEEELRGYLESGQSMGLEPARYSDEELRALPVSEGEEELYDEDPVAGAEEVLLLERVKELLIGP